MFAAGEARIILAAGGEGMKTTVRCENCSALYLRTETKTTERDKDRFDCRVCGHEIESWNGSRIPSFRLIEASKNL